jgi:hypothetical protein
MERDDTGSSQVEHRSGLPVSGAEADATQAAATGDFDIVVRKPAADPARPATDGQPDPIVLVVREILDLPRQILPEKTYTHLKNAAREATLAIVSLVDSLNSSTRATGDKTPRHIDVE